MAEERTNYDIDFVDKALVGEIVTLTLFVRGANGQLCDIEYTQVKAWLWIDDKTRGEMQTEGYRRRLDVGTYTFEWAPHFVGVYNLKIERAGKRLFSNAGIQVKIEEEIAEVSEQFDFEIEGADTRSARCGQVVPLTLTVTSNGALTDINMDKMKVKVFGNGKQHFADVEHKGKGKYIARITSDLPGFYAVTVIYETFKPVKTKVIFHEKTLARNSVLDNLPSGVVACNKPAGFVITSRDVHGQVVGTGGDLWQVEAKGPAELASLKIEDHQNGKYTVYFTLPQPGAYMINITLNDAHAKKSPVKITGQ